MTPPLVPWPSCEVSKVNSCHNPEVGTQLVTQYEGPFPSKVCPLPLTGGSTHGVQHQAEEAGTNFPDLHVMLLPLDATCLSAVYTNNGECVRDLPNLEEWAGPVLHCERNVADCSMNGG